MCPSTIKQPFPPSPLATPNSRTKIPPMNNNPTPETTRTAESPPQTPDPSPCSQDTIWHSTPQSSTNFQILRQSDNHRSSLLLPQMKISRYSTRYTNREEVQETWFVRCGIWRGAASVGS